MPDPLDASLNMLSIASLHPQQWHIWYKKLLAHVALLVSICIVSLNMAGFVFDGNDFALFARRMESLMIVGQTLIKQIILFYYRKPLATILQKQKLFWNIENDEDKSLIRMVYKIFRVYFTMSFFNIINLGIRPWITKNREFGIVCWVPNIWIFDFSFVYTLQIFFLCYIIFLIMGFDIVFASLCAHTIVQLKMINYRLANMDFTKKEDIIRCIKHHNLLIEIIVAMRSIYSLLFASQIFFTTLSLCMEIFITSESKSMSLFQFVRSSTLTASFAFQLCFICLPASEVSSQATEISNSIYTSQWYEQHKECKHYMLMVMRRSQKPLMFTAGGMATIDREIITQVFKSAASFWTLMKSFKEK